MKQLLVLLVFAGGAAACRSEPPPATTTEAAPQLVSVARVEATDLRAPFEAGGILRARATAPIASRVMAPIAEVHVRAGDRVRRGARLVTLDARETTANSTRAAATLTSATEATRAAESETRAAESQVRLARATFARISALHDKRSATAQELDQAQAALSAAEAQLASAQARAAAAVASRDAASAALEGAKVGVSYSVLTAPFDGVVSERTADPGGMALPGVPLLTLEDPRLFRLEVEVDEARVSGIQAGQSVDIRIDNIYGDRWSTGRIGEIARIDPASHAFLIKIDVPADPMLRSGTYGRARFLGARRRSLSVPSAAIVRRGQLTFVFTVGSDGLARLRPISPGTLNGDVVEVLAGLQQGDTVIVAPPVGLADGARVRPGAERALAGDRR